VRTSPYIMPCFSIVPGPPTAKFDENDIRGFRFWVPIDDEHSWLYILNMRKQPFADEERAALRSWVEPDYRRKRNVHNDYRIDRDLQRTRLYSGIDAVNPAEQDGCATETMGPICDRSQEHLGYSDKTIIALRKMLLNALRDLAQGKAPPHTIRQEAERDFSRLRSVKGILPVGMDWHKILDGLEANDA